MLSQRAVLRAIATYLLLPLTLVLSAPVAHALTPQEAFQQGNEAYLKQDYAAAIQNYEAALDAGVHSADLYYNLGNAWFKKGEATGEPQSTVGFAVLYYEKARRLKPGDADLAYNLEQARALNPDRVVAEEGAENATSEVNTAVAAWERIFSGFTLDLAGFAFLFFYLLFFALVLAARQARQSRRRRTLSVAAIPVAVLALASGVFLTGKYYNDELVDLGVVVVESIAVREGPSEHYDSAFEVHAGLKIRVDERRGTWTRVSLMNGLQGWVPADAVREI